MLNILNIYIGLILNTPTPSTKKKGNIFCCYLLLSQHYLNSQGIVWMRR